MWGAQLRPEACARSINTSSTEKAGVPIKRVQLRVVAGRVVPVPPGLTLLAIC